MLELFLIGVFIFVTIALVRLNDNRGPLGDKYEKQTKREETDDNPDL